MGTSMTAKFRKMLDNYRKKMIVAAGAHNPLFARIAEAVGFEAIYMSGGCTSMERIGWADVNLITATEIIQNAKYITDVVNVPVIADADNGYGNAINVMRTVRDYIRAGVAAIHIEDQVMPKRCGMLKGKMVISMEEMIGKIKAAKKVIQDEDPNFVLIARTDARNAVGGGLDEAIKRMKAYGEAGADVVFADAIGMEKGKAEIERAVKEVGVPMLYHPSGVQPRLSLEECHEMGIAIVVYPGSSLEPAAIAVWDYLQELKKKGTQAQIEFENKYKNHPLFGLKTLFNFTGYNKIQEYEKEFLPPEEVKLRYEKSIGL
ncbi:MAG: isocitrate lyase/PEP mutase family protein [Candidatus Bathyarchaeia archaeon]